MPLSIVVLIREDPRKTYRPAEGLRIALGLSTGTNPITIILTEWGPYLLTEEASETVGGELLEKHLPVIQELKIPILIPEGTMAKFSIDPGFSVLESSPPQMAALVRKADRVLAF